MKDETSRVVHFLLPADNPKWAVAFYESRTITKWEWSLVDRDFVAVNLQADQRLADLFPALRCEEVLKVRKRKKIRKKVDTRWLRMLVVGTDSVILALFWCSAIRFINRVCGY